jgi:signal transduction histidine kinase
MIDSDPEDRGVASARTAAGEYDAGRARSPLGLAESFLENAPAPVAIVDRGEYRIVYANAAFRRLHSMSSSPRARPLAEVLGAPAARELEALVGRHASFPAIAHEGVIAGVPGERALHCSVWSLSGKTDAEVAIAMIEMHRVTDPEELRLFQVDVTQRLLLSALHDQQLAEEAGAAERVAAMANAAKARFLTTMSHELRTPLNAIGGYAELIAMGLRGPVTPEQHHDLTRIQSAQEHLMGLINSVLNFAKLESGSVTYELAALSVDAVLEDVRDMLMPHLERQGLTYRTIADPQTVGQCLVMADPEKIRQILINLMTNAIKFTSSGGTITTSLETRDDMCLIRVHDTGRGISVEQLSTIFDPFVQVGRLLNSKDQGVGLGLSISRELARGMGGDLAAASTLGVGSTFTLTLKRASSDAAPVPSEAMRS